MGAWKKICCPVDFSGVSALALEEAAELAWRFGGHVTLLHVREPPPAPSPDEIPPSQEASEEMAAEHEQQLENWRDRAERVSNTRVDAAMVTGDPAVEIMRFAAHGRYDVIVMGTHGRTGREKVAFGSVAQKVVLDAVCPVLVVHRTPRAPLPGDTGP
jgi:nucleotide-binding universal stress UspA family protein